MAGLQVAAMRSWTFLARAGRRRAAPLVAGAVLLAAARAQTANVAPNVAPTPPMGENSWDAYGRLVPAENKFPSAANGAGFKPLADYVHARGLIGLGAGRRKVRDLWAGRR